MLIELYNISCRAAAVDAHTFGKGVKMIYPPVSLALDYRSMFKEHGLKATLSCMIANSHKQVLAKKKRAAKKFHPNLKLSDDVLLADEKEQARKLDPSIKFPTKDLLKIAQEIKYGRKF